jgi:thiol-disulfide isomerase/thioredoxin
LIIFYFSAKCPHCQHAFPHVQKLSGELASQGFTAIAVAVRQNTEEDLRGFVRDFGVHIPLFHDIERQFGAAYGTGSIPLTLLVNAKGEYIRYKNFDPKETPDFIHREANLLAKK